MTNIYPVRISRAERAAVEAVISDVAANIPALSRGIAAGRLRVVTADDGLLWQLIEAGAASVQAAASAEVAAEYADYVTEVVQQGHKPAAFAEWYAPRRINQEARP